MGKKLLGCGIIALGLILNMGCQNEDIKGDSKLITAEVVENNIIEFKSDTIDFSNIEYKLSETENNEELEKIIIKYLDYDKKENGEMVYFYNYIDFNGDGKEEIFVYLIGNYVSGGERYLSMLN